MTSSTQPPIWINQEPYQIALAALKHLQWSVFPLDEEKRPPETGGVYSNGHHARLGWKQFQSKRASPEEILYWQQTYQPAAWAVITGAISNIVLLDFDGEAGQQTRARLGLAPHVQTGSGGHHVYFRHPGWKVPTLNCKSTPELGNRWPGLDIRADGGYAAFCGQNTHGPYRWLRTPEPDDLALLPEALRGFLGLWEPPDPAASGGVNAAAHTAGGTNVDPQVLLTWALRLIQNEGKGRNDAGFLLACQLRDNGYTRYAAKKVMSEYVKRVPTENTKGQIEPYTPEEAFASVNSAFKSSPRTAWTIAAPAPSGNGVGASPCVRPLEAPSGQSGNGAGTPSATETPEQPETPEAPESLPEIFIDTGNEQLSEIVDQSVAAMMQSQRQTQSLFLLSQRLVDVGRSELGRPVLTQMGVAEVKEVLTHSATFFRLKKVTGKVGQYKKSSVSPPKELAEHILARQTLRPRLPFPQLAAIVETPVIRPDGSILDQPGYDPATQFYYAPQADIEVCKVPLNPTVKEREEALALLLSAIGEFPYMGDADKANALALLLTPLLRPAIEGHVPLALIDAPRQGTGKGLLSNVVSLIATGKNAAILTMSVHEDEMQKLITALLMEGTAIITLDNISGRLQSQHLDAVLTSDLWRGRILGVSKTIQLPQRATWIATGNNIKVGGDLARRCYRIRLDARVSRPFLRKGFKHRNLVKWVLAQRAELIKALLTLARAWYAAGKPRYEHLPALGTFSGWVEVVGGILEYAGVQGFLSNLEQLYQDVDEDGIQWEAFFYAWHQTIGQEWVPLATIVTAITASNENEYEDGEENSAVVCAENALYASLPGTLQMALTEKPRSFSLRLAKALDRLVDTCFGAENLRLEKRRDSHSRNNVWRISAVVAVVDLAASQEKNYEERNFSPIENRYRDGLNQPLQPLQPPQTEKAQNSPIGLGSGERAISTPMNDPQNSEQPPPTPATKQKRKRFAL